MIKANELRIGNLSQSKRGQILTFIGRTPINQNLYWTNQSGSIIDNNDIEPIPLTEEWLVKFGFDSINEYPSDCNKNFTKTDNSQYWVQHHTDCNDFIFYGIKNSIELVIKHVHQLQNIYFALTGEELKLNDK